MGLLVYGSLRRTKGAGCIVQHFDHQGSSLLVQFINTDWIPAVLTCVP